MAAATPRTEKVLRDICGFLMEDFLSFGDGLLGAGGWAGRLVSTMRAEKKPPQKSDVHGRKPGVTGRSHGVARSKQDALGHAAESSEIQGKAGQPHDTYPPVDRRGASPCVRKQPAHSPKTRLIQANCEEGVGEAPSVAIGAGPAARRPGEEVSLKVEALLLHLTPESSLGLWRAPPEAQVRADLREGRPTKGLPSRVPPDGARRIRQPFIGSAANAGEGYGSAVDPPGSHFLVLRQQSHFRNRGVHPRP